MATCSICLTQFDAHEPGSLRLGTSLLPLSACPRCAREGRDALIDAVRGTVRARFPNFFKAMNRVAKASQKKRELEAKTQAPKTAGDVIDVEVIDLGAERRKRKRS